MNTKYQKLLWDIEIFLEKNTQNLQKKSPKSFTQNYKNIIRENFYISENIGNNSFIKNKEELFVPAIIEGDENDILLGSQRVFEDEGCSSTGLENYILGETKNSQTPIFICDNHNMVLEAWNLVKDQKLMLVHIDQHKDDAQFFGDINNWRIETKICDYISCAQELNWIQKNYFSFIEQGDLNQISQIQKTEKYILNIDLDFFAPELTILSLEEKLKLILFFIPQAEIITLATSPLFIDQELAIEIGKLFWKYL